VKGGGEGGGVGEGAGGLGDGGASGFGEVGPDGVLTASAQACLDHADSVFVTTLRTGRAEPRSVLTALAELHVAGAAVDWDGVFAGTGARRVDLPTYAFQHQRYWLEPPAGKAVTARAAATDPEEAAFSRAVQPPDLPP